MWDVTNCHGVRYVFYGGDALGIHPFVFFHYTCNQRVFTQGISLGFWRISCILLCSNFHIIGLIGPPGIISNFDLIGIKGRLY